MFKDNSKDTFLLLGISLSIILSGFIHVVTNGRICFLFFNGLIVFYCVCVCPHHIFFIHSSVGGHLNKECCSEPGGRYLFEIMILFLYDVFHAEMELLDHVVVLLLTFFSGSSIPFSMVAAPVYTPTSSAQGFPFSTCYQHSSPLCLFDSINSHSDKWEVIPYCGLDFISLMVSDVEHLYLLDLN